MSVIPAKAGIQDYAANWKFILLQFLSVALRLLQNCRLGLLRKEKIVF